MVDDIFDNSRPRSRVEIRTGVGRRRRWTEEQRPNCRGDRIARERLFGGGATYEICQPSDLFAWRKTARSRIVTLPNEGELTFVPIVTPGDNSVTVGDPQEVG